MNAIYRYKVKHFNEITEKEEYECGIVFADKNSHVDAVKQLEDYYGADNICSLSLEFCDEGSVFPDEEIKNYFQKDIDI